MPCNSDYMEPSEAEKDSQETAKCLQYALRSLDKKVPEFVKSATGYYGSPEQLNSMVILLCKLCENMTEGEQNIIIYDGRDKGARRLATWWDRHQEADRIREQKEADDEEKEATKQQALLKLTTVEKEALGL